MRLYGHIPCFPPWISKVCMNLIFSQMFMGTFLACKSTFLACNIRFWEKSQIGGRVISWFLTPTRTLMVSNFFLKLTNIFWRSRALFAQKYQKLFSWWALSEIHGHLRAQEHFFMGNGKCKMFAGNFVYISTGTFQYSRHENEKYQDSKNCHKRALWAVGQEFLYLASLSFWKSDF